MSNSIGCIGRTAKSEAGPAATPQQTDGFSFPRLPDDSICGEILSLRRRELAPKGNALILDDNPGARRAAREKLEAQGYRVDEAGSLAEAKACVVDNSAYNLIVSDYDLGRSIFQKHHAFDGWLFLRWCRHQGIAAKIIFHSTVFEPQQNFWRWLHLKALGIERWAKANNVTVQPKTLLLAGTSHWALKP